MGIEETSCSTPEMPIRSLFQLESVNVFESEVGSGVIGAGRVPVGTFEKFVKAPQKLTPLGKR